MSLGAIIFSRLDSSRLPFKSLLDIGGKPMLERVIERAFLIGHDVTIVLATSDRSDDDPIADLAFKKGLSVFRGDLSNVALRAQRCSNHFGFDYFARICGDRPFFDPHLVRDYLHTAHLSGADVVSNAPGRTFPAGLTTEVIKVSALSSMIQSSSDPNDLEHLANYFYRPSSPHYLISVNSPLKIDDVSLTVDTPSDLDRARFIAEHLGPSPQFASIDSVVRFARLWNAKNVLDS
jgi:spore coat polysaccharide biosynthesis protein SpsF